MPSYNSAARNYNNYPEYDDDFDAPAPTVTRRPQPTQGMPAYRVAGQGGQITRQVTLPQPLPGATPRRQPTNPNVPVVTRRAAYAPEYDRRLTRPAPAVSSTRRVARPGFFSALNFQPNGSTMRIGLMGLGLVVVLVVSYLLVSFAVHTWQTWQDDMTYGRPRITRLEASVNHNEVGGSKTLFIAQNLKGQISITEFPGGDPSKTRVIVGPHLFGKDTDLIPIKLQVKDVNADGQPDLIATADDQQLIYINENGSFRPINDQEKAKLKALGSEDSK